MKVIIRETERKGKGEDLTADIFKVMFWARYLMGNHT